MHAGLDSLTAKRLLRRVERKLQVAQPGPDRQQTYTQEYLTAAQAAGIPTEDDPLSRREPPEDGMWLNPLTVGPKGRRQDSCAAYLDGLLREGRACAGRVDIVQSATVSKVVIEGGRTAGVRYLQGQQEREVSASAEVVLAAGPFGSPKILQLSGVGPASVLDGLNIDVVMDLPVGQSTVVCPPRCVLRSRVYLTSQGHLGGLTRRHLPHNAAVAAVHCLPSFGDSCGVLRAVLFGRL